MLIPVYPVFSSALLDIYSALVFNPSLRLSPLVLPFVYLKDRQGYL